MSRLPGLGSGEKQNFIYIGQIRPKLHTHCGSVLRDKPVRLEISLIVNLSRIFMRLTLPNMSMVIISLSCLIVKQVIEYPAQF